MSDFTPKLPEVKFNRNGYEIRTEVLAMAKDMMINEFHAKLHGWEISVDRDEKTSQVTTKIGMPEFPGLDQVLTTAQKMYEFVEQSTTSFKK